MMPRLTYLCATIAATLLACFAAHADPGSQPGAAASGAPTIHIVPMDPHFDASKMAVPGSQIDSIPQSTPSRFTGVPLPVEVDRALVDAHLSTETAKMDRMDRDNLYQRAELYDLTRLKKIYPKISSRKLRQLSVIAKARSNPDGGNR